MKKRSFIVVGAGQAGGQAVRELRRLGYDGDLLLVGAEDHYPYERPPLSKSVLTGSAPAPTYLGSEDEYRDTDVEFKIGVSVKRIDLDKKHVALSNGERRAFDRLLIATGSKLRQLTVPGLNDDDITYLRTLDDCRTLEAKLVTKPKVAVVGGGFIGLEVAATARKLGCDVSVVEASPILLSRLQVSEISEAVMRFHQDRGIAFQMGAKISAFEDGALKLDNGESVAADVVVAGIGVTPDDGLAKDAGLKVDDGILVDLHCRTSHPDIMAAGDVTRQQHPLLNSPIRLESWENANFQAQAAVASMLDLAEAGVPAQGPWVWSDQGDLNLQIVGFPDKTAETVIRLFDAEPESLIAFQLSEGRLTCAITLNRAKDMVLLRRLLTSEKREFLPARLRDESVSIRELVRNG